MSAGDRITQRLCSVGKILLGETDALMDPVSLLVVQAVSPIALYSDVVRSGRPGGVDPVKSVLKGSLSGPSHREVAGVEFTGWSGNAVTHL